MTDRDEWQPISGPVVTFVPSVNVVVHCITSEPLIDLGLYCRAYPPSDVEDMRLLRRPGQRGGLSRVGRRRYLRAPMPAEARAALRAEMFTPPPKGDGDGR